jgi:acyl-CoA reductase-like NAD-dependent aldehyde dehydrogenase
MAIWKLAPALLEACLVLKLLRRVHNFNSVLMELIGDILPPGVINIVNGFGTRQSFGNKQKKYQLLLQVLQLQDV